MNLEHYESAWRSSARTTTNHEEAAAFVSHMTRSARRQHIVLSICAVNAGVTSLFTVAVLLFHRPLDEGGVASALGLQALLTLAVLALWRRQRRRRRALQAGTLTVLDSARAAFGHVTGEMKDVRLLLWLAAIVIPMLALSVRQLMVSGKMNTQQATSFALVCAVIIAANAAYQWRRYNHKLAPQKHRLEQILSALITEA